MFELSPNGGIVSGAIWHVLLIWANLGLLTQFASRVLKRSESPSGHHKQRGVVSLAIFRVMQRTSNFIL